jgi:hypothetical protein
MSRIEHHSAFGLLIYYSIYVIWTGTFIVPSYYLNIIVMFSILPDFDTIYYFLKAKGRLKLTMSYQHHLTSLTHYPIIFSPYILVFIISVILNYNPLFFLIPVVGIYGGHFLFDSLASGDGIMWGKNPFRFRKYTPFINKYSDTTDGYHGRYWDARYRKTKLCKIGNLAVFLAIGVIFLHIFNLFLTSDFILAHSRSNLPGLIFFFSVMLFFGLKKYPEKWQKEPSEGRYSDYRVNKKYINGLSEENRRKHLEKFEFLFQKKEIHTTAYF